MEKIMKNLKNSFEKLKNNEMENTKTFKNT